MKTNLSVRLTAMLLAALTVGIFLSGCGDSKAPMDATSTSQSSHTSAPKQSSAPETTEQSQSTDGDRFIFNPELIQYDQCTANADERATEQGWVCLNDYISNIYSIKEISMYDAFDGDPSTALPTLSTSLQFSRPVEVYAAEFTFTGNQFLSESTFSVGFADTSAAFMAHRGKFMTLVEHNIYYEHYESPTNVLWIESSKGFPYHLDNHDLILISYSSYDDPEVKGLYGFKPAYVQEVRVFGRVLDESK